MEHKMAYVALSLAVTSAFAAHSADDYYRQAEGSPQLISSKLPDGLQAYRPARQVDLSRGIVIAANYPDSACADLPQRLQEQLQAQWGERIPIVSAAEAAAGDRAVFLIGTPYANDILCRFTILGFVGDHNAHYELRAISQPMEWAKGAIYMGGANETQISAASQRFLRHYPRRPKAIGTLSECPGAEPSATPEDMLQSVQRIQEDKSGNHRMVTMLFQAARNYHLTGNDAYADVFAQSMRLFLDGYEANLDFRRTSPHFVFHRFPIAVDLVEESAAFGDAEQLLAAEVSRYVSEEVMSNKDVTLPLRLYNSKRREYMTNHPMMASRCMYFNSSFLLRRYDFKPAAYWLAFSEHAMECVSDNFFSPEDSLPYLYHVLEIFIYYAYGSGRYGRDVFTNADIRDFMRYTFAMMDQRGGTIGLGDTYPVQRLISYSGMLRMIRSWVHLLGSDECTFYLKRLTEFAARYSPSELRDRDALPEDVPPPGEDSLGLQLFPVRPERFASLKVTDPFSLPALDKAIFRSSWNPDAAEYLCLTGINGGPHGHFDANGIAAYVIGDFDFLADRDYIRKYPDDHNSVSIVFNGRATAFQTRPADRHSFSQLVGSVQRADRSGAALSLLLEDYNHTDWRRHIAIESGNGLWVIDDIRAREAGDTLAVCSWRVLGRPTPLPNGAEFHRVAPGSDVTLAQLAITEATGSTLSLKSQFDSGSNAREHGYFGAYAETGGENTAVMRQRHQRRLEAGERIVFVNRLHPDSAEPSEQISDTLWRVGPAEKPALVGIDQLELDGLQLRADFFKLDRHGLLLINATHLTDGAGRTRSPGNAAFSLAELNIDVNQLREQLLALRPNIPRGEGRPADVAGLQPAEMSGEITALAMHGRHVGIGTKQGLFEVRELDGTVVFRKTFANEITAAVALPENNALTWVIGVHPGSPDLPNAAEVTGQVIRLDQAGNELWRQPTLRGNVHRGIVRSIAPLGNEELLVGSSAWMYLALNRQTGAIRCKFPVLHPATVAAVGDLDGDGNMELCAGSEYYDLRVYRGTDAKEVFSTWGTTPHARTTVAADLDADGRSEFYCGRSDGTLVAIRQQAGQRQATQEFHNLGGPPAGAAHIGRHLVHVSTFGTVTRFAGKDVAVLNNLPASIAAFAGSSPFLVAAGSDGRIYQLSESGQIQKVYSYQHCPDSPAAILAAASPDGAVVASGSHLYTITE